jgi:hypothetical protein
MGQFLPPDHSAGDESTVGGYHAVHSRPAAFEGKDGMSYSVEIVTDETGGPTAPYAGYLLFVRWRPGDPVAAGHLETGYLIYGKDEATVLTQVGSISLLDVKRMLDTLIDASASAQTTPTRPWYEAMRDA